ncbi:MAG: hypothetical protein ACRCZO_13445 [Cetobacterium sp.]
MMELKTLSSQFYNIYDSCPQILKKENRAYSILLHKIDDIIFAIPIRGNIDHPYCLHTPNPDPQKKNSGLDFSKAIPILDPVFIGEDAHITSAEFNFLKTKKGYRQENAE